TILSRCLQFNLRRLLPDQVAGYLEQLVATEGIEAEPEALAVLARAADGSMRDGLSLLDQAIAYGGGRLAMSDLEKMLGLVDHRHVVAMVQALAAGDAESLLAIVGELVAQSRDLGTALGNLAEVLHRVTLVQCVPGYRDPERSDWDSIEALAGQLSAADAQLFYQIAVKGRSELPLAPDPRTGLEMALLRMLAFRPAGAAGAAPGSGASTAGPAPSTAGGASNRSAARAGAQAVSRASDAGARESSRRKPAAATSAPDTPRPARATAANTEPSGSDWNALLDQLDLSGQVRELARNVQLKSRSDDRWDFLIAPALRHLGSTACVTRLSEAISDRMGHPVSVRIFDQDGGELRTAAALEQQQVSRSRSEAERAIRDDPTVRALQEQMGARLVEDSIQPLQ
ncbi:MAG: DNA polymerase III subunit gamma/tau C-terminal domain-containing protein, partial [Xanthomonadales bacterium]|nr:DNA polymerase III subunit gamma/tau C-terminal domain-containing protein [Xanthomonadales bacterium]